MSRKNAFLWVLTLFGSVACSSPRLKSNPGLEPPPLHARAQIVGSSQHPKLLGQLELHESAGVRISGRIQGLRPRAIHALHIHEIGDCSAPDFSSTGAHFNPDNNAHGSGPDAHLGDLGNIKANRQGVADVQVELPTASLGVAPRNLIGRSVVLRARGDDLRSQPYGNSGPRIACGVIEADRISPSTSTKGAP